MASATGNDRCNAAGRWRNGCFQKIKAGNVFPAIAGSHPEIFFFKNYQIIFN
jgi:hypothetical protein